MDFPIEPFLFLGLFHGHVEVSQVIEVPQIIQVMDDHDLAISHLSYSH